VTTRSARRVDERRRRVMGDPPPPARKSFRPTDGSGTDAARAVASLVGRWPAGVLMPTSTGERPPGRPVRSAA
jgi:hypothetical protein